MLKAIHAQESKATALAKARDVVAALKDLKLKEAVKKVEDSMEETLTYMAFCRRAADCFSIRLLLLVQQ